jgi:hydrogenase maturation factor HypF (carbamoyltransferase family)
MIRKTAFQRQRIFVQGIVQGVCFHLVNELGLSGPFLADDCGVTLEVEEPSPIDDSFIITVCKRAPVLARVDTLKTDSLTGWCHQTTTGDLFSRRKQAPPGKAVAFQL